MKLHLKRLSWIAAVVAAGVAPAYAQDAVVTPNAPGVHDAAPAAGQPFQVVRPGDTRMSCEALAAEVGALEAEMDEMHASTRELVAGMQPRSRVMPGQRAAAVATAVGGAAVPGAGMAIAAASNQAMMGARTARREQQMDVLTQHALAQAEAQAPLMNRMDHLLNISNRKRCPAVPIMGDASVD